MMKILFAGVMVLSFAQIARAENNTVANAYALCQVIDGTGLGSAPCDVSGWNQSVTAVLDMNSEEARSLCSQVATMVHQKGMTFDDGWTLQIQSPYSNGSSIAYCQL